jgi:preprotein translocase subunit SecE
MKWLLFELCTKLFEFWERVNRAVKKLRWVMQKNLWLNLLDIIIEILWFIYLCMSMSVLFNKRQNLI